MEQQPKVRMAGVKYIREVGLSKRVVYNSISPEIKEGDILAIREAKIESAILLALNNTNPTIAGRLSIIQKLLKKAHAAGVEKTLIDTTVARCLVPKLVCEVSYASCFAWSMGVESCLSCE
jgi:tetrahydromethanopterin S-methyltransferase subunit H